MERKQNLDKTAAGILGMARTVDKQQSKKPRILACDPSLTAWGWVVLEGHIPQASGVIVTKPEAKKRRIRVGDDDVRRVGELITQLVKVIEKYNVTFIVTELPHGSQSSRGAITIGIVLGVLQSFNILQNIPVEWFSEQDAKKALLGRISATKQQVIDAVADLYEVYWTGKKYVDEAVADALAIYYCAEQTSPTIKFMNK